MCSKQTVGIADCRLDFGPPIPTSHVHAEMNLGSKCKHLFSATTLLFSSNKILLASSLSRSSRSSSYISMKSFTTLRQGGTIIVSPKNEAEQSGLVVICHGLGDSAEGFVDVAEVSDYLIDFGEGASL